MQSEYNYLILDMSNEPHLRPAIEKALAIAKALRGEARRLKKAKHWMVEFSFSSFCGNIIVRIGPETNLNLIMRDWGLIFKGLRSGPLGPYPSLHLTPELRTRAEEIQAEWDRKAQAREVEQKLKQDALRAKLATLPPMERDEKKWQDGKEEWGNQYEGIFIFVEAWAQLMQLEMAQGKKLADMAEETSREAAILYSLSGSGFSGAIVALDRTWKYGGELRQWYDNRHQHRNAAT